MTEQKKKLLLKDLCARLPYGITIYRITDNSIHRIQYSDITENIDQFSHFLEYSGIDNIKPYLRPMSSMTEEEKEEWHNTFDSVYDLVPGGDPDNEDDYDDNWHEQPGVESYDYLIAHHFDYRGLIPMGLALEAPEDMYEIK